MISISTYRQYPQPGWYYRQQRTAPPPGRRPQPPRPEPEPPKMPAPEPRPAPRPAGRPAPPRTLPLGLDPGDLLLGLVLLLLYSESRDEDFLIMLAVIGLSIFGGMKGQRD